MSNKDAVEAPQGFFAAGGTCGIKESGRPDLAILYSKTPAAGAAVFTTNRVVGAPVIVSRPRVPSSSLRAVVINSGNANACTGQVGVERARAMTEAVADQLGCPPESVLVCSTGVIGVPLPVQPILDGIPKVLATAGGAAEQVLASASAMMTTDTFPKVRGTVVSLNGGAVRITGIAKGAAMIAPNMATMLSVILCDAVISSEDCDSMLRAAVDRSFHCIHVDGHTSTSDTVILLSNGCSHVKLEGESDRRLLQEALNDVSGALAQDIIRDAEGADHLITIEVAGFASEADARKVGLTIADSALVKTAVTGADPNWGRIVSAAGYSGIEFEPEELTLEINGTCVYRNGIPVEFPEKELSAAMRDQREVSFRLQRKPADGSSDVGSARIWTSDLTAEYVRLNSEYTT